MTKVNNIILTLEDGTTKEISVSDWVLRAALKCVRAKKCDSLEQLIHLALTEWMSDRDEDCDDIMMGEMTGLVVKKGRVMKTAPKRKVKPTPAETEDTQKRTLFQRQIDESIAYLDKQQA